MNGWNRLMLALLLSPALGFAREGAIGDGSPKVALIKMPYRGERNLPDLSDVPDYLERGGIEDLLQKAGCRLKPVATVALSAEERKEYGEWNRLGLANGQLARLVAASRKEGFFPVGLLANCSALPGMLGGLQHSGPTSRPLRVGLVFSTRTAISTPLRPHSPVCWAECPSPSPPGFA